MIVNNKHCFVFIHIPKVAGTSIRSTLSEIDGIDKLAVAKTKHETPKLFFENYEARTGQPLSKVRGYKYIAFVRNPWARVASLHKYLKGRRSKFPHIQEDMNDFIDMLQDPPEWALGIRSLLPQADYLEGCRPWVGRFEFLNEDFKSVCNGLGIDFNLPHKNSSANAGSLWREEYNSKSIEIVRNIYKTDIELLGYCFESDSPSFIPSAFKL